MTPLQMAQIYAAIANGGTMWKPTVGRAIITPTGELVREIEPEKVGKLPVDKKTLSFLRKSLRAVITEGTAQWRFQGMPIEVSGKTGTGEVYGKNPDGSSKDTTSWFASYAPSKAPRYAVVMMISQGGTGSGTSGPSVRKIFEAIFGVQGQQVVSEQAIFPSAPPSQIPRRPLVAQP
jgi:penicillin-binding protein 2